MYPLSEVCREYGAFLVDFVIEVVNLNEDSEEDVDFGDNVFLFLFC